MSQKKKKILLIQYRDDVSLEHDLICFENKTQISRCEMRIINPITDTISDSPQILLKDIKLVITGGSGQYYISKSDEGSLKAIDQTKALFDYIFEHDFPTLGACYSHQLIALHQGGQVEGDPKMAENGTQKIKLNNKGIKDELLGEAPDEFYAVLGHKDSVTKKPKNATLLASSDNCHTQIFKYKENIYTTMFHPELSSYDVLERLKLYPQYLHGQSVFDVEKSLHKTPEARKLIERIVKKYVG